MISDQFIIFFYGPLMIWVLLMIVIFFFLLKKYTLGNWTTENPNPYVNETLGLPSGFFRGIITLTLMFGVVVFELYLMATEGKSEATVDQFMVAFQMMIAFYFGSKVMQNINTTDAQKVRDRSQEAVEVAKVVSPNYPTPAGSVGKKENDVNYKKPSATNTTPAAEPGGDDFYDPQSNG